MAVAGLHRVRDGLIGDGAPQRFRGRSGRRRRHPRDWWCAASAPLFVCRLRMPLSLIQLHFFIVAVIRFLSAKRAVQPAAWLVDKQSGPAYWLAHDENPSSSARQIHGICPPPPSPAFPRLSRGYTHPQQPGILRIKALTDFAQAPQVGGGQGCPGASHAQRHSLTVIAPLCLACRLISRLICRLGGAECHVGGLHFQQTWVVWGAVQRNFPVTDQARVGRGSSSSSRQPAAKHRQAPRCMTLA